MAVCNENDAKHGFNVGSLIEVNGYLPSSPLVRVEQASSIAHDSQPEMANNPIQQICTNGLPLTIAIKGILNGMNESVGDTGKRVSYRPLGGGHATIRTLPFIHIQDHWKVKQLGAVPVC